MMQRPKKWIIPLAAAAFVVGGALPAQGQVTWDEVPLLSKSLLPYPALSLPFSRPAPAAAAEGGYPNFTVGVRLGGFFLTDGDSEDTYGVLPLIGADAKLHLGALHAALQTSFDWSFGEGEVDEINGMAVTDSDSEITLYAWRLSALLEPAPGTFGGTAGGMYVTPYVGVGVGLHIADEEVDGDTTLNQLSESAQDSVVGYHALVGIDFVFKKAFSVGAEVLYTLVMWENALDDNIDIGGFSATIAVRLHF